MSERPERTRDPPMSAKGPRVKRSEQRALEEDTPRAREPMRRGRAVTSNCSSSAAGEPVDANNIYIPTAPSMEYGGDDYSVMPRGDRHLDDRSVCGSREMLHDSFLALPDEDSRDLMSLVNGSSSFSESDAFFYETRVRPCAAVAGALRLIVQLLLPQFCCCPHPHNALTLTVLSVWCIDCGTPARTLLLFARLKQRQRESASSNSVIGAYAPISPVSGSDRFRDDSEYNGAREAMCHTCDGAGQFASEIGIVAHVLTDI